MAVMMTIASLRDLPVESPRQAVWERVRDSVLVAFFGGRPGFGDGPDEHRFRIDNHWPEPKFKEPWE